MKVVFGLFLFFSLCLGALVSFGQKPEVHRFYEGDILKEAFQLRDSVSGVMEGRYRSFFRNGILESQGEYRDGLPDGKWFFYYKDGRIQAEGTYQKNIKDGCWAYYALGGRLERTGCYVSGNENGEWVTYGAFGEIKFRDKFENGRHVERKRYLQNRSLTSVKTFDRSGLIFFQGFERDKLSMEGMIVGGERSGSWVFYYGDGKPRAKGAYLKGKKEGVWKYYYPSGKLRSEGLFENGSANGKWKEYYESGRLREEGVMEKDSPQGYWKMWSEDGKRKGGVSYKDGLYTEVYPSGATKVMGHIRSGKRFGDWSFYREDGSLEGEAIYAPSGEGHYRGYYEDGQLSMEGTMRDAKRKGLWKLYDKRGGLSGYYRPFGEVEVGKRKKGRKGNPSYMYKAKRKSRYFQFKNHEARGWVAGIGLAGLFSGKMSASVERYWENRLGLSLSVDYWASKMGGRSSALKLGEELETRTNVRFGQWFYHEHGLFGNPYFGHRITYSGLTDAVKANGAEAIRTFKRSGNQMAYGWAFGVRNQIPRPEKGVVGRKKGVRVFLDVLVGLDGGYRWQGKLNHADDDKHPFKNDDYDKFVLEPSFSLTLGLFFP
ncbi:hypothetical protein FUAX_22310 [Fulvitalea axinellae]|uniref:Antitoxin component YwqK of the YwqJK toxin-antitoxin module n=1 Tax=Fulvitalea axinellae TaxID=1182444 RepID=A0AAU9D5N8_9BACT|nr:hypothetical protein FUAX_22310 [Fulvitalea axinellae]